MADRVYILALVVMATAQLLQQNVRPPRSTSVEVSMMGILQWAHVALPAVAWAMPRAIWTQLLQQYVWPLHSLIVD